MSGPDHYREAERLLTCSGADGAIAAAQVHATLALAAATMDAVVISGQQANSAEWIAATS